MSITEILIGAALLFFGVAVGWGLRSRNALAPSPTSSQAPAAAAPQVLRDDTSPPVRVNAPPPVRSDTHAALPKPRPAPPATAPARDAAPARRTPSPASAPPVSIRVDDSAEIERLKLRLINCFGGNEGAMRRTVDFEWKKFPHLSEKELLKKMLYDFERGH